MGYKTTELAEFKSLIGEEKLNFLVNKLSLTQNLNGDIAEVGVYKGGSAIEIFKNKSNENLYLFDTFEGIPLSGDNDNFYQVGDLSDSSYESMLSYFKGKQDVFVYKGTFPNETGKFIINNTFKFVHLDVDTYESYQNCLKFFSTKMEKGGLIFLDDYNEDNCKGATKAVQEFIKENTNIFAFSSWANSFYLTKI